MWIETALERGGSTQLTDEHWSWALLLGEARRLSNEGKRAANADRSESGNRAVDLLGALAEIFLLRKAIEVGDEAAVEYIRHHIYAPEGGAGVVGPDAQILDAKGGLINLDAKTYQAGNGRRFFAINDHKHQELDGRCDFYFCVLVKRFGDRMTFARLVPYSDVSQWECCNLMRNGRGSKSRNLGIKEFAESYCRSNALGVADRAKVIDERSVFRAAEKPCVRQKLLAMLPNLPLPQN